jgi:predicted O-methyltransferase YrrM
MILELGTGLGISGMYLSAGSPEAELHTVEGIQIRTVIAKQVFKRSKLSNVEVHHGEADQVLENVLDKLPGRYLAFVDANHRYDPTVRYVRSILGKAGDEAILILDDIYWSKGMHKAWKEIIQWPEVRVSIDLFHMGILLLRKDIQENRMKIKF